MSIAVLNQVYDEARRLAVAGSVVAGGDFRLKKLLPPLDQAGAKAPVFAKVAECARAVIDGQEDQSAERLLELTSLVTAVLYTQGETGAPGKLEPIATVDFGATTAATSARLLKPLLEALSSTGSGRLEQVKEAHSRGAFRDLRLVTPALAGLDDPYAEIADFFAEKVMPMYGQAILPELRAKYDPKGARGHARRLKLMHATDPAGTRELIKEALDAGSKEVKVAAISCLGAAAEDLPYLMEQAGAKAQEVRAAAYRALAMSNDPAAVATLEKALAGKDAGLAAAAIGRGAGIRLTSLLVAEIETRVAAFLKTKDKKTVSQQAERLALLIGALPAEENKAADALTLDLFGRRAELNKVKGETLAGADVSEAVIARMMTGPKPLQAILARAHADLDSGELTSAFLAARDALPAAEVYDLFAGYLTATADGKKGKGEEALKAKVLIDALDAERVYWFGRPGNDDSPLDRRWIDAAVKAKHLGLIHALNARGHAGAEAFVKAEYDAVSQKGKTPEKFNEVLIVMVYMDHPFATDALLAVFEKYHGKANSSAYWYYHLIPALPKSAVPRLEAIVPKLKDREADHWLAAIQELRGKP